MPFIEGRRAVLEALETGVDVRRILLMSRNKPDKRDQRITQQARDLVLRVATVDRRMLDELSAHGAHQGIMAEVPDFSYTPLERIIDATEGEKDALILVLDHITDEGNLGAIIRSAEVVGASGVVIPAKRAAQVGVGVYKTSAGAALHIPIARVTNIADSVEQLKRAGFWVAGASEKADQDIWSAPLSGRIALVSGAEDKGISRLVTERCDFLVSLPQRGRVASLNVAQATTAICYEWLRRTMTEGDA